MSLSTVWNKRWGVITPPAARSAAHTRSYATPMMWQSFVPHTQRPWRPRRSWPNGSHHVGCAGPQPKRTSAISPRASISSVFTSAIIPPPTSARSGYKLLITPSTGSITQIKRKLKGLWRRHVGSPTVALINAMNPVIRGWSNYFRTGVASKVSTDLDNFMYYRAQRYMKRRHPRKSGWWRTTKYWGHTIGPRQDRWVFVDKVRHATLRKCAWTKIIRHRLVPTTYSPDDPTLQDYWRQRRTR